MYKATVKVIRICEYYEMNYEIIERYEFTGATVDEVMHKVYNDWDIRNAQNREIQVEKI